MATSDLTGSGTAQSGANIVGSGVGEGPGPDVMAASTLEDTTVITSDGEDVGKIKHVMLDVRSGRIAYAVLASGGFLGIGDTLRAIPWNALTLDTDQRCSGSIRRRSASRASRASTRTTGQRWRTPAGELRCISFTIETRIGRPHLTCDVKTPSTSEPAASANARAFKRPSDSRVACSIPARQKPRPKSSAKIL